MDFNSGQFQKMPFSGEFSPKNKKILRFLLIVVIIVIFIVSTVATSIYLVNDKQQAVITTFGEFSRITGSGLHFKLPFGIQKSWIVDVNVIQKIEIGYSTSGGYTVSIPSESKMITGDLNIVNVDFFVEYRISDPKKYLFESLHPEEILKNITQSQIRSIVSSYQVDDVLTTKKAEIQTKIKDSIIAVLEVYDIGLILLDVKIQDSEPPTEEVIAAFRSVETARQGKETAINEARAYENANIPRALAQEDQLIKNAEFLKQNRINDAIKQVAMFEAMYSQYVLNPEITRERMYYEMIEQILPGIKVYIDTQTDSNTSKLIPLDDFSGGSSGNNNRQVGAYQGE